MRVLLLDTRTVSARRVIKFVSKLAGFVFTEEAGSSHLRLAELRVAGHYWNRGLVRYINYTAGPILLVALVLSLFWMLETQS